jgi:hypothetical protein
MSLRTLARPKVTGITLAAAAVVTLGVSGGARWELALQVAVPALLCAALFKSVCAGGRRQHAGLGASMCVRLGRPGQLRVGDGPPCWPARIQGSRQVRFAEAESIPLRAV